MGEELATEKDTGEDEQVVGETGAVSREDSGLNVLQDEQESLLSEFDHVTGDETGFMGAEGSAAQASEDVIPTAIVIKNIPFAIKKEQLLEVIAKMDLPLPYAFNYHFDNGVFRGLAFANFTTTEETTEVVQNLNGKEIGSRRLRVEYKKMLPQAERERIEREKREKRGQLEEQHRSVSNISLQSLNKLQGNDVMLNGTSNGQFFNKFVNGQGNIGSNMLSVAGAMLLSAQNTASSIKMPKLHSLAAATERYYVSLPSASSLPLPPQHLDFNDPETLEIYSQLLLFKDKDRLYYELAYPIGLSATQKRIISLLCSFLGLLEVYDPSFVIVRRKPSDTSRLQTNLQQQVQASMMQPLMHPLQPISTGGSLQRTQSYTSALQGHATATVGAVQQQQQTRQHQISSHHQQQTSKAQFLNQQPPSSPVQIISHPVVSYDNLTTSQQQLLRPQCTTSSLLQNRIPSGYTTLHTPSSLLRQHGVPSTQNQIQTNSASSTSRMGNLLYTHANFSQQTSSSLMNDNRLFPGLQAVDSNSSLNNTPHNGSTAPLIPQDTNGSVHSNYSVHSIHDYVSIVSAGNQDIISLEDGLTKSLSGLDLGSRNFWA